MYTVKERKKKMNDIIDYFKTFSEAKAILLLGSTTYGFKDIYSDMDISVIVDSIEDARKLFKLFKNKIENEKPLILADIYFKESHYLLVCVFDNLLEINVSIANRQVFKIRQRVKLAYHTKDFDVNYLEVKEQKINDLVSYIKEKEYIEHSVYFMKHVLFLTLRNDFMNASGYMANIRELLIKIYGLKTFGKLVDKFDKSLFDDDFKLNYQKTYTNQFNQKAFLKIFDHTFLLLLDIINDEKICSNEDYKRYHKIYQSMKRVIK